MRGWVVIITNPNGDPRDFPEKSYLQMNTIWTAVHVLSWYWYCPVESKTPCLFFSSDRTSYSDSVLLYIYRSARPVFEILSISANIHSFSFWNLNVFYDVLWCSMVFYDVLWCSVMFYDVLWCFMMFYDVLCLKSILGFLLSERTSGVSPVIFYFFVCHILHLPCAAI